jgi:tetratricopeptide (TPR) repeat protein
VAAVGGWLILALAFGVYYVQDQQARSGSPQQTQLNQKLRSAEEAVRANPNDAAARIMVADLYAMSGKYAEAARQYEESLRINQSNLPAINGLAVVYAQLGQAEKAQPMLEGIIAQSVERKVLRTSADIAESRLLLGQIYLTQGKLAEAREQATEAAAVAPANADILLLAGQVQAASGDFQAAVGHYRKALRFVPKFPEAYQGLVAAYEGLGDQSRAAYARAMVSYSGDNYDQAARDLEQIVRSQPELADARLGLGMAYERLGKRAEAASEYRESLRLDPTLDYAKTRLAGLGQE